MTYFMELVLITCLLLSQTIDPGGEPRSFPKLTYILRIFIQLTFGIQLYYLAAIITIFS